MTNDILQTENFEPTGMGVENGRAFAKLKLFKNLTPRW